MSTPARDDATDDATDDERAALGRRTIVWGLGLIGCCLLLMIAALWLLPKGLSASAETPTPGQNTSSTTPVVPPAGGPTRATGTLPLLPPRTSPTETTAPPSPSPQGTEATALDLIARADRAEQTARTHPGTDAERVARDLRAQATDAMQRVLDQRVGQRQAAEAVARNALSAATTRAEEATNTARQLQDVAERAAPQDKAGAFRRAIDANQRAIDAGTDARTARINADATTAAVQRASSEAASGRPSTTTLDDMKAAAGLARPSAASTPQPSTVRQAERHDTRATGTGHDRRHPPRVQAPICATSDRTARRHTSHDKHRHRKAHTRRASVHCSDRGAQHQHATSHRSATGKDTSGSSASVPSHATGHPGVATHHRPTSVQHHSGCRTP